MGLRVNTNVAAMTAQRNLHTVSSRLNGNYSRLSSGLRIATAADDAAGLGISERMRSQIKSFGAAARNTQDGISLVQTAEGALNEVSSLLTRGRELAVQSANGTLSQADRDTIQVEFAAIKTEIERIADDTSFNGVQLLDNTTSLSIQVGINSGETVAIAAVDTQGSALGITSLDLSSQGGSTAALATLDTAIGSVNTARGSLGASQNRLQSALSSTLNARENLSAAESRIRDVDIASETTDLTRNSILQQAATSVLSQANVAPQIALSLLG
ncbi:MAG: flagellin [Chlamydiales bacterium]|jgi:flagellin